MNIGHIPNIGARQLIAVLSIAEHRSFVAAAAELRMSQPALTRSIKRIEDMLGVSLFERTTRSVRLTDAGREFVPLAQRMLDDIGVVTRAMRELAGQQRGHVTLTSLMSVALGVLPEAVAAYRQGHPGIEIRIRDGIHESVVEDVRSGAAEFGITYLQGLPTGLLHSRLGHGHFVLIARRDSAFATSVEDTVCLEDLRDAPLISMPPGSRTRQVLDMSLAGCDFALRHAAVVSQIPTLMGFIRAGVGVGLVPSAAISGELGDDLKQFTVRDLGTEPDIGILQLPERSLSPAASGLLDVIRAHWPAN